MLNIFVRKKKKQKSNGATNGTHVPSVQDFLGIKDIQNGIVHLSCGGYRMIIEVIGAVNYFLLSANEQDAMEDMFARFVSSLNFPVQFYIQTKPLDLSSQTEELNQKSINLNSNLQQYAASFARYLSYWAKSGVLVKRTYVVFGIDNADDPHIARQELLRRRDIIEGELLKWVACRTLDTKGVLDVLYTAYNKSNVTAMKPGDAENYGFLTPLVEGVTHIAAETLEAQR